MAAALDADFRRKGMHSAVSVGPLKYGKGRLFVVAGKELGYVRNAAENATALSRFVRSAESAYIVKPIAVVCGFAKSCSLFTGTHVDVAVKLSHAS
jgi:acetoacetate decarboxylase